MGTLRWVMGCEVSYFPISLCCFFSPPTFPFKPGTLTVYFPTPPPFLTPATLSYYAGTMYLASPPPHLHLATIEHSAPAISEAIGKL